MINQLVDENFGIESGGRPMCNQIDPHLMLEAGPAPEVRSSIFKARLVKSDFSRRTSLL